MCCGWLQHDENLMLFSTSKKRQIAFKSVLFFLVFIPLLAIAGTTTQDLPDFGDSAGRVISPEYDRRLGQLFLKQIRQYSRIVESLSFIWPCARVSELSIRIPCQPAV